jgi:signal transduction histidine kinase
MHSSRSLPRLESLWFHLWTARQPWTRRKGAYAILFLACWLASVSPLAAEDDPGGKNVAGAAQDSDDFHTNGLGSWIWAAETFDRQTCQLWRSFEIPRSTAVTRAQLWMTVDNEYTLFLDGRELGRGDEWRELFDYDVTPLMSPGWHTLAVKAYNSFAFAGMLFGLRIDLADGRTIEIKSDENWRIVPVGAKGWERAAKASDTWPQATIIRPFGAEPWWTTPQNVNAMPTPQPIRIYFWQTGWFQITLLSVCGLAVLFSLRLMAQLALHNKERLLLRRERARIARDIHDDLGPRITQLALHGEVAQSELPPESNTRCQLDRICQEARDVLSTLDEILWAVNPRRDTLNEFSSYVCAYAEEFLKPTAIQCRFDVDLEELAVVLDLPLRRALLMAIKESLNNAVKYSGASELLFQIKCHRDRLLVVVQDNGNGFDLTTVKPGRNGMTNMTERMKEIGGSCLVRTRPGGGCRIEFAIALNPHRWQPFGLTWKSRQNPPRSSETKAASANEGSQNNATSKC